MRQLEIAELMIASNNFTTSYAECLLAATPQEQLVDSKSVKEFDGLSIEDMETVRSMVEDGCIPAMRS